MKMPKTRRTKKTPQTFRNLLTDEQNALYGEWMTPPASELKRIAFVPDCHVPNHDPVAYACMIEVVRELRPHILVILGDYADFYCVSSHLKRKKADTLRNEAALAKSALTHLVQTCGPQLERKIFIAGNHEDRFDRYVLERAPELAGITSIAQLLGVDVDGWEYVPYGQSTTVGHLHLTHDTGSAGANAHTRAVDDFQGSAGIGHTHRMAITYMGQVGGTPRVGFMLGWLGSIEKAASEYKHRARAEREWMLGMGSGYMTGDGVVYVQAHPIVNGRTVINGKVVSA